MKLNVQRPGDATVGKAKSRSKRPSTKVKSSGNAKGPIRKSSRLAALTPSTTNSNAGSSRSGLKKGKENVSKSSTIKSALKSSGKPSATPTVTMSTPPSKDSKTATPKTIKTTKKQSTGKNDTNTKGGPNVESTKSNKSSTSVKVEKSQKVIKQKTTKGKTTGKKDTRVKTTACEITKGRVTRSSTANKTDMDHDASSNDSLRVVSISSQGKPSKKLSPKIKTAKNATKGKGRIAEWSKLSKGKSAKDGSAKRQVKKELPKSKEEERKDVNKLYSRLLVEHRKQDVVKITIAELLRRIGSDNYSVASNKRHISRILQACLKYGDKAVRAAIFDSVKKEFTVADLNVHSARFLIKVFHYCNAEAKDFLRKSFFNDRNKALLYSRYGSLVMDTMYQKLKNKEQLSILRLYTLSNHFILDESAMKDIQSAGTLQQFITAIDKSKSRDSCVEKLRLDLLKMVDKAQLTASLAHDLIYIYWKLTYNKTELISLLYKVFGQMLSTRNGNTVLCDLFGYADKKMRKSILKGLKTDFPEAVYNQLNVTFLIKAVLSTDDTKMSIDCLIKPLQDELAKLISHPYGHQFIHAILEPCKEVDSVTSLKDTATRQNELQEYLIPRLVELFKSIQLREVIENKFARRIILSTLRLCGDSEVFSSVVDVVREDVEEEMSLFNNLETLQFIQTLIKKPGENLAKHRPYAEFWPIVKNRINRILSSKCVFILVCILEAAIRQGDEEVISDFKEIVTVDMIRDTCRALNKKREKHVGLDILLKLLS
ncbi:Pumilio homology domain family member 6 [Babesia sp. Xinjiang]|uniref:Pumilio homology domain family member 6 n=1 Tax=Babesia sp. Xinjiang TaxID=462227 RepID=UPI000A251853|nr:Pumilio homology domain family member 6 [Babesia sp. Xinjiang]XP_028871409.1 Pumilio homology domain family member 6 [Babesia sp. Xinjiang]ORM40851.1 Pumilio homology domain family member 6 [Babesia sp. Xinjiang]ORM40953.1 Pumilio homology domain family member 6 [Babesia sp. Xinjiang]